MTMYHVTWRNLQGYQGHMAYDSFDLANATAQSLASSGHVCVKVERY